MQTTRAISIIQPVPIYLYKQIIKAHQCYYTLGASIWQIGLFNFSPNVHISLWIRAEEQYLQNLEKLLQTEESWICSVTTIAIMSKTSPDLTIGFIGAGKMAQALGKGFISAGKIF